MPLQLPAYPRWFVGLRGFILGVGVGSIATADLLTKGVAITDRPWHGWVIPGTVFASALLLTGIFELGYAIRRHRRLQREMNARALMARCSLGRR